MLEAVSAALRFSFSSATFLECHSSHPEPSVTTTVVARSKFTSNAVELHRDPKQIGMSNRVEAARNASSFDRDSLHQDAFPDARTCPWPGKVEHVLDIHASA